MKNKEKFAKERIGITCSGDILAMSGGILRGCNGLKCKECNFYNGNLGCGKNRIKWAESEYIKPRYETDWASVPVDTPVINSNGDRYYFAKYNNIMDVIHVFIYGCTSWSSNNSIIAIPTNTCKLFREEDRIKYRKLVD